MKNLKESKIFFLSKPKIESILILLCYNFPIMVKYLSPKILININVIEYVNQYIYL